MLIRMDHLVGSHCRIFGSIFRAQTISSMINHMVCAIFQPRTLSRVLGNQALSEHPGKRGPSGRLCGFEV